MLRGGAGCKVSKASPLTNLPPGIKWTRLPSKETANLSSKRTENTMRARTRTRGLVTLIATLILQTAIAAGYAGAQEKRPMTFMDVINIRSLASPAISPDGKWLIYTVATPDWKAGKRFSHIYLVSMDDGVSSTRQMTFTKDKDEVSPRWSRDSRFFVFASNRDSAAASPTQN